MNWWVTDLLHENPVLLGSWVFWVIASITLHELAHGYVAIRLGDDTPIHTGHMTLNPLVHMSPMALILFALFGFTWGAMPVNPSRLRGRYGEALMSFAGPACNAVQFVVLVIAGALWIRLARGHASDNVLDHTFTFLSTGAMINVMGFFFNLVPIPPLDGWRVAGDIFPRYNNIWRGEHGGIIGLIAFSVLFYYGGDFFWGLAGGVTHNALRAAMHLLGSGGTV